MNVAKHGRGRTLLKILGVALLVVAAILVGKRALRLRNDRIQAIANQQVSEVPPWALETVDVRKGNLAREFPALATLTSKAEIVVNGQLSGSIIKMGPREGVAVKKGDLLAQIDSREIEEQIKSTEAKLRATAAATANLLVEREREKSLLKVGGSTQSRVDTYETSVLESKDSEESLRRSIAALNVRRGYGMVRSPTDGVIAARLAEPGAVCSLAHPLYRITVAKGARVTVKLPQRVIEQVEPGTTFSLAYQEKAIPVVINRIHPALDADALGMVESDLEERPFGLPSGARVKALIALEKRDNATIIPARAFLPTRKDRHGVLFKVVQGQGEGSFVLELVRVIADLRSGREIAVLGDVQTGDAVVVAHRSTLRRLKDGDNVQPVRRGSR